MITTELAEIAHLSVSERIQLAEDIWDTIVSAPDQLPLSDAQRAELDRRLQGYRDSPVPGQLLAKSTAARPRAEMTLDETPPDIIIQPEAESDISEAFRWYEDKDEGLGSEFMRALDATLSAIQRAPTGYAILHNQVRRAMLRRFPYGVFYLYENEKIIVIACFHASRAPKSWQDRA